MSTETTQTPLPPQAALYQLGIGHYITNALHLAVKLGVADLLKDGPRHADELARATQTHAPSLRRVLRLLSSVDVFEERENGAFALTSMGECLRAGVPGSARAMVMLFTGERVQDAWRDLEYCVRTGNPVYRKRGLDDPFKDPARTPEDDANFDAAMADYTALVSMAVAAVYDFAPLHTLVDVGGGNGALLIGLLRAHRHLRGIVFDQPHAAERAQKAIAEHGLSERCDAVGGDFFKEVPRGGDAYVLKHVIHDWDDQRALGILVNCRRAMPDAGKLLTVEGVYPPRIEPSLEGRRAAANDVNMLVNTGGRQRSEAEFHALYDAAGFALTRIVPTPAAVSIVEGVRK
jgi:hypothetical protein